MQSDDKTTAGATVRDIIMAALADGAHRAEQIQGFRYATAAVVRDCRLPLGQDELWSGERDDTALFMQKLHEMKRGVVADLILERLHAAGLRVRMT